MMENEKPTLCFMNTNAISCIRIQNNFNLDSNLKMQFTVSNVEIIVLNHIFKDN